MSLLLLFGGGGGGVTEHFGAASFSGVGSFSAIVRTFAQVSFSGAGSLSAQGGIKIYALATFEGQSSFLPISRFAGTDYSLLVVSKTGSVYGEIEDAQIGSVTFELNGVGGLDFTIPITNAGTALVQAGREVQLYRGNQLLFWGPIVRQQIGLREATYQCAGLFWYFTRRFLGRADRVNQLTNGDFENGETGWTFNGGVGHSVVTDNKIEGARALFLTGSAADHSQHASQTWEHTGVTPESWPGDTVVISAWVYIPSGDYDGGAIEDFGLVARHRNADGDIVDSFVAEIGDDTQKDEWIQLEVAVPAVKGGESVDVLLFPPHGTAYFDLVTATFMESLSFFDADIADIIAGIVDYAQDRAPYDFDHGKSDLNIGHSTTPIGVTYGSAMALVGVTRTIFAYQFAEHRNIADAILEFVRTGKLDFDIAITPTTRTLTTYAPRKGHHRSDLTLELDVNLADFSYSWDGEAGASSVVVLGPGDGPDRPEGGDTDPSAFGGLTLEWVEQAPDDVTVGELDDRATERLRVGVTPVILEATTLPNAGIIGQLQIGDTVPVDIDHGPLSIDATYRAVGISINPVTDQATLTLNVEA